ncbi:efflux RND transporter periplasmic adaptor subunit [Roseomonas frigidaquae]|uniref:Efflux RND transporter periplasmic adaptor subunit n=1 Tax=Falsiroseomonas frigidaquae TaxID=487318 RepID=A0ABX1EUE9_9PROT|nr:efflux RND transporter periplasmic adaptor subunit [Falsiroseomonas frigidaquae]NKE44256.1 efflux RND transporter periplasmic adaptor subunit [Falsiroseomonas frigidaquae]
MNDLPRPPKAETPQTSHPALRPRRRARWLWLVLLLLLGAGGWYGWQQGWFGGGTATTTAPAGPRRGIGAPAIPVTAATATVENLPIMLDALGTVQASNTVTIAPQVSGRITEILFREGQEVKAGDVLVRIDARSYQAALDQAVATRAQRQAQLANAQRDLQRYTQLARSSGTSQQTLDTQRATVAQLEAQLQFDQATIDNAQAQLDDTTIRSPIDGRIGLRLVDVGNFVQSSSTTGIVVVTQLRPVAVTFTLPQQTLPQVMEALQAGPVPVEARLAESAPPRLDGSAPLPNPIGRLVTVDNQVDATTGTIKLKAEFENADLRLWPGAFVNTRIQVATLRDVVVLPLVAVQRGPQGPYAFVVKDDNTVEQRPLTLGTIAGQQAVVLRGMRPGERAVSSGALRLVSGSAVQVAEPVVPVAVPRQVRRRPGGTPGGAPGGGPGGRPGAAQAGGPPGAAPEGGAPAGAATESGAREGAAPARRPAAP